MITVHHLEDSRSQRVLWLLEELAVPYEVKRYDRDPITKLAPDTLYDVHPLGKSPALTTGDGVFAETGAIFEYILETHDSKHMLHGVQKSEQRRALTYWLHYAEGSAMPLLLMKLVFQSIPERAPSLAKGLVRRVLSPAEVNFVNPRLAEHAVYWDNALKETGWFAGSAFSAADIMMSFPVEAAKSRINLTHYRNVMTWLERCQSRPAYAAALEKGGPYAYA
ncbi:MAG: glutathione S-transferase [Pseudomonadota bacterium]